jgi:hypothetical protein
MRFFNALVSAALAVCVAATPISGVSNLQSLDERAPHTDRRLSINRLKLAMKDASEYVSLRSERHDIIVQGGAVNVIMGDRSHTSDMDYIATNYVSGPAYQQTLDKLKRAFRYSFQQAEARGKPIESKWADNTIQFFFHDRPDLWAKYLSRATSQSYVLSTAGIDDDDGTGIRFIAAPFDWQFVGKMVNVGSVNHPHKPYDFADAAGYLKTWLGLHHRTNIDYQEVKAWFAAWGKHAPSRLREFCAEVNRQGGRTLITGLTQAPACAGGSKHHSRRNWAGIDGSGTACNGTLTV